MGTRLQRKNNAYGIQNGSQSLAPLPIIAQRAPTSNDLAEIGTTWVDQSADSVWVLTSITSGASNWETSPASGVGTFTSLTVNPGNADITAGNLTIAAGNLAVTAGNTTMGGNLTVSGVTTLQGDINITTASAFDITATGNQDPAILLNTNGGVLETIQLINTQGTAVDAIEITATAGGVEVNSAGLMAFVSSRNNAQAMLLSASAGGIDILASGAAAGEDIDLVNTAGSINLNSGEVIADSMVLTSAGGLDITVAGTGALDIDMVNSAGSININAGEAVANAVRVIASNAAGGIDIDAGTGGIAVDSTGAISLDAAAASNFSVSGAAVDLTLASAAGSVNITAGESAADSIVINSTVGGIDILASGAAAGEDIDIIATGSSVNITSTEAVASAIVLTASNAAGGISVEAGSNGVSLIGNSGNVSLSTLVAGEVVLNSAATVTIDSAGVLELNSSAGVIGIGNDAVAQNINVGTGAAARTITIGNATGATSVVVNGGTGAMTFGSNATDHATTVGSTTGASLTTIQGGTSGIALSAAGIVSMAPATDTQASPSATATINARVFKATFTGFTTAAAGTQAFTITNSAFGVGDGVIVTVSNAGTNDAKMTLTRVDGQTAGSLVVHTVNNGSAALNGNVVITGWIID